ncbi:hypothetical protein [Mesorhizobium sp. KR9-304]|uniref:hypothetical protein n=1 Tax=Mesorhizobium sp. KR9-304 TaxID=3156614 RepID=UPI0032B5E875
MPSVVCANPTCPRQAEPFYARTRRALYCSPVCRSEAHRNQVGGTRRITDPVATVDRLQEKHGFPQGTPLAAWKAKWVEVNSVTHKLVNGKKELANVVDRGPHWSSDYRVRWEAVMGSDSVSPNDIEAMGYRADLSTAKAIVEAWLTGRLAPVVVKNLHDEDCTEDAWIELHAMLSLLGRTRYRDQGTEESVEPLEDFSTEEQMVVRLNREWAVVVSSDGDRWVLQRRIGEGNVWRQIGRFNSREALAA